MERRFRLELTALVAIAVAVRLPFWLEAWRVPADADTAIVGLMARHWGLSSTFWGQPYGSPLEAWLAAPLVALGGGTGAIRLVYFALSLVVVAAAYLLAGRIDPRAALPAGLIAACPPAYILLHASLPPPLYPTTLALGGLLLAALDPLRARIEGSEGGIAAAAAWGGLAGLALWNHLTVACVVVAGLLFLLPPLRRRRRAAAACLGSLILASSPLWTRALADGQIFRILRPSTAHVPWTEHAAPLVASLGVPLGTLLGTGTPVVADLEHRLRLPGSVVLAPLWGAAILGGAIRARHSAAGRAALLTLGLGLILFLVPERSEPHTVRFLAVLYVPCAALAAASCVGAGRFLLPALIALHVLGGAQLISAWRQADRAAAPYHTPDLSAVVAFLEERRLSHAYASYEPAYRLTWESGEHLVVSQPWNERFPLFPLPYADRVRHAPLVAWVLVPGIPSELPRPEAFEQELRRLGIGWRVAPAGPAFVYYAFTPPLAGPAVAPAGPRFALAWTNGRPAPSPEPR